MTTLFKDYGYCFDTSALINLKNNYPREIFDSLWVNIESLIAKGLLVAPREVFHEIQRGDDELIEWVKRSKKMFVDLDLDQIEKVRDVLSNYESLAAPQKESPHADPFIISLALSKGYSVITQESKHKPGRIPDVCNRYNIKCLNLLEFIKEQGWRF